MIVLSSINLEISYEIIATLFIMIVGWGWVRWRNIASWRKKEFKNRILLSLNCVENKEKKTSLKLRTLFENDIHETFHNTNMVSIVQRQIKEVKIGDPLLRFSKDDAWYVLNAVLNQISQQFAAGILKKDMGLETTTKIYTFCLTFEIEGALRMQKPRVMMIEKEKLQNFPDSGEIEVESDKHKIRIETLRTLKKELKRNPHLFMDVELSI